MFRKSMFVKGLMGVAALVVVAAAANLNAATIADDWDTGYTTEGQALNSPWVQQNVDVFQHVPFGATTTSALSGAWSVSLTGGTDQGAYIRGVSSRPTGAGLTDTDVVATAAVRMDTNLAGGYARWALSPYAEPVGNDGWEASTVPGSLSVNLTRDGRAILYYQRASGLQVRQDFYDDALVTTDWVTTRLSMPNSSGGAQSATLEWKVGAGDWNTAGTVPLDASFSATYIGIGATYPYIDNRFWIDDVTFSSVPEPSTLVLLGCGLVSLVAYAWRKRR